MMMMICVGNGWWLIRGVFGWKAQSNLHEKHFYLWKYKKLKELDKIYKKNDAEKSNLNDHLLTNDSNTSAGNLTNFCLSFLLHLLMFLVFLMT